MLPKRFDQARPFLTLGIVLLLWLVVPLVVKTFTRSAFFEIQAPLNVADSYVADLQNFWATELHSKKEMMVTGRETAGLIAQYSYSVQQNTSLHAEILRLENLLKLPQMPSYRFEAARVVRSDFSGWWQRITIRKGSNYSIPVGAPVIFSGGVVGRIVEVHAYTSVVDLVTSPTFAWPRSAVGDNRLDQLPGRDQHALLPAPRAAPGHRTRCCWTFSPSRTQTKQSLVTFRPSAESFRRASSSATSSSSSRPPTACSKAARCSSTSASAA